MQHTSGHKGFALIELIVVMLAIGILAATVVVRVSAKNQSATIIQADQLRRDVSHIQMLALSWGVSLRLATAVDGASYTVSCLTVAVGTACSSVGTVPTDPATGQSFSITLTDGVRIAPAGNTLDFDSLGRPLSSGDLMTANRTFTLTGSGTSASVSVQPITGFAEMS